MKQINISITKALNIPPKTTVPAVQVPIDIPKDALAPGQIGVIVLDDYLACERGLRLPTGIKLIDTIENEPTLTIANISTQNVVLYPSNQLATLNILDLTKEQQKPTPINQSTTKGTKKTNDK